MEKWPDELWILLGSCAGTRQPTRDRAMNPMMALKTFDVSRFLANNVGIVVTGANINPPEYHEIGCCGLLSNVINSKDFTYRATCSYDTK